MAMPSLAALGSILIYYSVLNSESEPEEISYSVLYSDNKLNLNLGIDYSKGFQIQKMSQI